MEGGEKGGRKGIRARRGIKEDNDGMGKKYKWEMARRKEEKQEGKSKEQEKRGTEEREERKKQREDS